MGEIRPLLPTDARALSQLLAEQRKEYLGWFHPFEFDEGAIEEQLSSAVRDRYWGIERDGDLVGFFMLRGLDAGYARPSYGVFVAEKAAGLGLARASLGFALEWCATCGIDRVMLKVAPENHRARAVYESAGFVLQEVCASTGHLLLEKRVSLTGKP